MADKYLHKQARAREAYFRSHPEKVKMIADHLKDPYIRKSLETIQLFRGWLALDLGAGNCWASRYLAERNCRVVAFDFSMNELQGLLSGKEMIDSGESPEFHLVKGDWNSLPFKKDSFDLIFAFQALHHSTHLKSLLQYVYPILKKNGVIISIGDPTMPSYVLRVHRYGMKRQTIQMKDAVYDHYYKVGEYIRAFRLAGFSIQKITPASGVLDILQSKRLGLLSKLWGLMVPRFPHRMRKGIECCLQPINLRIRPHRVTIIGVK